MRHRMRTGLYTLALLAGLPMLAQGQGGGEAREAARARREARREAMIQQKADQPGRNNPAMAERLRLEGALRAALGRAVRERLNLTEPQSARLMEVNRRFSEDRMTLARDEMRIRRDLRFSIASGDSSRSPETARLLDDLLDTQRQRQRLELQQKEQAALSEFLTPEQRARYIAMMEQLRRRIQARADSIRGGDE